VLSNFCRSISQHPPIKNRRQRFIGAGFLIMDGRIAMRFVECDNTAGGMPLFLKANNATTSLKTNHHER
jgi:hypothetical protein